MERIIKKLDHRLEHYNWHRKISYLDHKSLHYSYDIIASVTRRLANIDPNRTAAGKDLLIILQSHMFYLCLGITSTLRQIVKELPPFNFQSLVNFRQVEESLLRDLEMPSNAWERFWITLDNNKDEALNQMRRDSKYTLRKYLIPGILSETPYALEDIQRMSPFSWSKAIVGGAGATMAIADGLTTTISPGTSAFSFIASILATAYVSGKS
jgi:hypothetical protein